MKFYPYERLREGEKVQFKLSRGRRVVAVQVNAIGWSGSHLRDGFRIILKKDIQHPPRGWVQTGHFYGQYIGGHKCGGYQRAPINKFSNDFSAYRGSEALSTRGSKAPSKGGDAIKIFYHF